MLKAVTRQASAVDAKIRTINADPATKLPISTAYYFDHYATPEDVAVMVTEADFLAANDELIPSVSAGELAHYEKVRATFEGGREKPRPSGQRVVSTSSTATVLRGKGKAVASASKGKGKAIAMASDDEEDEVSQDDAEVNGRSKGKGKAPMGFQDGTESDDDGLY